ILNSLVSPARIYFKITAINKTGLRTESQIGNFTTPADVYVPADMFGVMDFSRPIQVSITNPSIPSVSYAINGYSGQQALTSTSTPAAVWIDSSALAGGSKELSLTFDGFSYTQRIVIDTDYSSRNFRLARLVVDNGGTYDAAAPGGSMVHSVIAQAADQVMESGQSRLYLGYLSGIDPVAPSSATLGAVSGPGTGAVTLSWADAGDDANVGTAMSYELRKAQFEITAENFNQASLVPLTLPSPTRGEGGQGQGGQGQGIIMTPLLAGTTRQFLVSGLADGTTYFFALKVMDELLNYSISNTVSAKTFEMAQSTDSIGGSPVVSFVSQVPGITISQVDMAVSTPAVALATSATAAQGLVFAGPVYDIINPLPSLPGGAVITFHYQDLDDPSLEEDLRIYQFNPSLNQWIMVADVPPDTANNVISAPVASLSLFSVMLKDRKPPMTTAQFINGEQFRSSQGRLFASSNTLFGFLAQDPALGRMPGSGTAGTQYRLDLSQEEPFIAFTQPFGLTEGFHTLDFRSWDMAGNTETVRSLAAGIDAAGPRVSSLTADAATIETADGLVVFAPTATIIATVIDPVVSQVASGLKSVSYSVDRGSFTVYEIASPCSAELQGRSYDQRPWPPEARNDIITSSFFSVTLGAGLHLLKIQAQDNVGNALDQTFKIVVGDNLPPRTTLAVLEPSFTAVSGPDLQNSALNASSVSLPITFVSPMTIMTLTSTDDLREPADGQGSGVSRVFAGLNEVFVSTFANPSPAIGQMFTSSFVFFGIPDGLYDFKFSGEDVVGNKEQIVTMVIAIDRLGPLTKENGTLYATSKDTFGFVAMDNLSGVKEITYQIDEGSTEAFAGIPISFTQEGRFKLRFSAIDQLGNQGFPMELTIIVDDTAPTFSGLEPITIEAEDLRNALTGLEVVDGSARLITKKAWPISYEGNVLPENNTPPFKVWRMAGNYQESLENGIYRVDFPGPRQDYNDIILQWSNLQTKLDAGFTIEMRARINEQARIYLELYNINPFITQFYSTADIFNEHMSAYVRGAPAPYWHIVNFAPGAFHVFRWVYRAQGMLLFLDGNLVTRIDYQTPGQTSVSDFVQALVGSMVSISGSVEVDYIRINDQEALEPSEPAVDLVVLEGSIETPFLDLPEITKIAGFRANQDPKEGQIIHEFTTDGASFLPIEELAQTDLTSRKIKFRSTLNRDSLEKASPTLDSFSFELKRLVSLSAQALGPLKPGPADISFITSERLISSPTVTVDGGQAFDGHAAPSLSWRYAYNLSSSAPSGVFPVKIEGADLAGNAGTDMSVSLIQDFTAPAIAMADPKENGKFIAIISSIPVNISLTDNFDPNPTFTKLELVQVENKGLLRGPTIFAVSPGDWVDPFSIDDGLWVLEAEAKDWVANSTRVVSGVFEVIHDIMPPRTSLQIGNPKLLTSTNTAGTVPGGAGISFLTKNSLLNLVSLDDLITAGDGIGLGAAL
ncbi:MAG: hypothetical protein HY747_09910, partial [Elusimicrobia bacterium]|nr:hypothetical protein [Elusimicrobiota bacterium]